MRLLALLVSLSLAACATVPGALPAPRYADAASRGALATVLAGRPNQDQVDRATQMWSNALSDSVACRLPAQHVIDAGLVGALEIGAMNAAASGGGQREVRQGVERFLGQIISSASQRRDTPPARRCDALAAWAPRTAAAGREAVERARHNGLMSEDYGLLMGLLVH